MIAQKPIVRVNQHGCIVDVVWAPPFEGPVATDSPEDMERFYRAYTRFAGMLEESTDLLDTVRLQPGDVLTFNNRRMLHGRTPFRLKPGTRRHLKVSQAGLTVALPTAPLHCGLSTICPQSIHSSVEMHRTSTP